MTKFQAFEYVVEYTEPDAEEYVDRAVKVLGEDAPHAAIMLLARQYAAANTAPEILHLLCPHCLNLDTIAEVDKAIRWNDLSIEWAPGEEPGVFASTGDHQFDNAGFICTACQIKVGEPDGFTIDDWS